MQDGFVEFSEAKASGTSIGVTAQGQIDLDADTMEITGSIAPLDMINSFLGNIFLFSINLVLRHQATPIT